RLALLDQLRDVSRGQRRGLEQSEQARERRPELVRDGGREAGAELLVGSELVLRAQVDERLAPAVELDRDALRPPRLGLEQFRGHTLPGPEPLDRLTRASTRSDETVLLV